VLGYHGRYLKVDAGSGLAALQPLDEAVLRRFLGGCDTKLRMYLL
jgi:hypothetical protein